MDLLFLSKKAIHNPLHFKNFFVLFITTFIILTVGLSLIAIFGKFFNPFDSSTACDFTQSKKVSGQAQTADDVVYQLNYTGNSQCFLSAFLTWKKPEEAISLWVYDPTGKVEVVKPDGKQTHTQFYQASPLSVGDWKFVIRAVKGEEIDYSGNFSIK